MNQLLRDRARGCLAGLAVGDALGRPTEGKDPAYIQQRWGRIEDFVDEAPGGSDDTEYALFTARVLLQYGTKMTSHDVASEWVRHIVSQDGPFHGAGFSEMAAVANLRRGLQPPASGQHYHSWSDGLAMRVAPLGIAAAGNPVLAARLAVEDGSVSHAGEGIYSGIAVASAIAAAIAVHDPNEALEQLLHAPLATLPSDSWTVRSITTGIAIGRAAENVWEALKPLYDALAVTYYPWTDLGPEAVGLAFGLVAAGRGRFRETVLGAVNLGRDADTVAAIAGAMVGAVSGHVGIPASWREAVKDAQGNCLRCVRGLNVVSTADELASFHASGVL